MKVFLLPCEIYHREFNAKLLVATILATKYNSRVLIGYDKYMNILAKVLPSVGLLEKSASSIMYNGRIKPVKENKGGVIVIDEEGINQLRQSMPELAMRRVSREAAKDIDVYGCWSQIDHNFYSKIADLSKKRLVVGNPRSDLLGKFGVEYYNDEIRAIRSLFGDYILASDNFAIERWGNEKYILPRFENMSDQDYHDSLHRVRKSIDLATKRRIIFADYIKNLAERYSNSQIVIRPHPVADHLWWHKTFRKNKNVNIILKGSIEPWIHASSAILSMGCTSGLQGIVANKKVIEIDDMGFGTDASQGYARHISPYEVNNFQELQNVLKVKHKSTTYNRDQLKEIWKIHDESLISFDIAKILYRITPELNNSEQNDYKNKMNIFQKGIYKQPIKIDESKWEYISAKEVRNKVLKWANIINADMPGVRQVTDCLFEIGQIN